MDLVDWSQKRFDEIAREARRRWASPKTCVIPMSALQGDNVVDRSDAMPWYEGPTLLEHLETVEIAGDRNLDDRRFPVQWVIRPMSDEHHDYRGYAARWPAASGARATRSSSCRPACRTRSRRPKRLTDAKQFRRCR